MEVLTDRLRLTHEVIVRQARHQPRQPQAHATGGAVGVVQGVVVGVEVVGEADAGGRVIGVQARCEDVHGFCRGEEKVIFKINKY